MQEIDCVMMATSDVLGPLVSVEGLPPHADEAGSRRNNQANNPRTAMLPNPLVWRDGTHEEDGTLDTVGDRQQDCRQLLRDEFTGVLQKDGVMEAWDDVSGKSLEQKWTTLNGWASTARFRDRGLSGAPARIRGIANDSIVASRVRQRCDNVITYRNCKNPKR